MVGCALLLVSSLIFILIDGSHLQQRQSLNEVENLYFHHSTLKGKSKVSTGRSASTMAPLLTSPAKSGSSPKGHASSKKTAVNLLPEQDLPLAAVAPSPPTVVVSPPPTTTSFLAHGTSPPPHPSTPVAEGSSSASHTPSTTPAGTSASDAARSASFPASVLSAFSQNYTVSQQQLSHAAAIDFSTLSPFVTASPFASPSATSLATPSSFVAPAPFPPQQTLAYPPSPFAPPPPPSSVPLVAPTTASAAAADHFSANSYPIVTQAPSLSVPLSTFPPFPALSMSQPPPTAAHTPAPVPAPTPALTITPSPSPNPNSTPAPTSQRALSRHTPAPIQPPQTKPPPTAAHTASSFRPSKKTFDIPTAPGAGTGTLGMQNATTTLLTYDSFWSSHVSAAATAGGGVGGWRRAAGATPTLAASTGTATSTTSGGAKA